ncbi:MAG: hypothetical protein UW22_C0086G0004 [Candidatus Gottesmanbacteria bacterium GW2011_GWB1_44_11c]|uniref:Uncharacterized protein n=1 Tax=Candidatus Gottesmanbacteria bacterium GW2011_GWB1_44_11c TaxID=1618447 RepID=A0A0G1GHY2_9BACT|nr:MAG: hypothetical protein UW22_C0086G0004 [Candidatus Gottesmanbacteria bacterium GW2011_GWB1_44_11c]
MGKKLEAVRSELAAAGDQLNWWGWAIASIPGLIKDELENELFLARTRLEDLAKGRKPGPLTTDTFMAGTGSDKSES